MEHIKRALKYPFAKWQRMFYYYLGLLPFIGYFTIYFDSYKALVLAMQAGEMVEELAYIHNPTLFPIGMVLVIVGIITMIAFLGYELEFLGQILKGKDKALPKFGRFQKQLKRGIYVVLFIIIMTLVSMVAEFLVLVPAVGGVLNVIASMLIGALATVMFLQYVEKEKFNNFFKVKRAWTIIKNNVKSLIVTALRMIAVTIILIICSLPIVTLVVTLPAMQFSSRYLIAQWYRKAKKPTL